MNNRLRAQTPFLCVWLILLLVLPTGTIEIAAAQGKTEKSYNATLTDSSGVDIEVKNLVFYWEEKVSETAFVPHELRHVPVKRGNATVNVKFETIKQIELKPGTDKGLPILTVTLASGKTGEFTLAIAGNFRGLVADFGENEVEIPAVGVKKVQFK
jgi:sporulation protein YlmC with PRC-barrel domain